MLCLVIGFVLWISLAALVYSKTVRDYGAATLLVGILGFLIGLGTYWSMCLWGGFMPEYSVGVREGFITKLSKKGVIFKTNEGDLQIGTGDLASLQQHFEFSVTDDEILGQIEKNLGKRVVLHYRQWILMPYRVGDSGYEIMKVEPKGEAKK